MKNVAQFSYSTDGKSFQDVGDPYKMVFQGITFQGVRYSLFAYNTQSGGNAGFADFDSIDVNEPDPHGLTKPVPYGKQIELRPHDHSRLRVANSANSLFASPQEGIAFTVVDRGLGRVALHCNGGFVSVNPGGIVSLRRGRADLAATFQWIETLTGELTLMSLVTNRYLRVDFATGSLSADSRGPRPDGKDGVRFDWEALPADSQN